MQLQLKRGLRRVWRAEDTLQIGLSQRHGTVLGGLTTDDLPFLDQLRQGVDASLFEAADDGLDAARRRELVRLLAEAGVLISTGVGQPASAVEQRPGPNPDQLSPDAAIWSVVHPQAGDGWGLLTARAGQHVVISGAGRLGSVLAATLAAAGVGQITVSDQRRVTAADLTPGGAGGPDLGRRREDAALEAVQRLGAQPGPVRSNPERWMADKPDLVVLIEHGAADAAAAASLLSADITHLSVVIREDDVMVGPLVRPGSGPCLRCLDLHRGERDPAWPTILGQLLGPTSAADQPEETVLSTLAAGLVGLQALAHLDGAGEPATAGATLEIELPDGLIARRGWPAHPGCGCHWPPPVALTGPAISPNSPADPALNPATDLAPAPQTDPPVALWATDSTPLPDPSTAASLAGARSPQRPETIEP